jgi:hypothetical protein
MPFLCRRSFLWSLVAAGAVLRVFQYVSDTSLWYDELDIAWRENQILAPSDL